MARSASATPRCTIAGMRAASTSSCSLVVIMSSSCSSWRRSATAKSTRGRRDGDGRRRASKGSDVIGLTLLVETAERVAGADEQRLGGVDGTAEDLGDFGHGQTVDVAERERDAMVWPERVEDLARARLVDVR